MTSRVSRDYRLVTRLTSTCHLPCAAAIVARISWSVVLPSLIQPFANDFRRLQPGALNRLTGLRVGVAVAVPLLTLMAVDRLEWAAFGAFGAFSAVYGRSLSRRVKIRQQAQAGSALVVAVMLGTTAALSAHPTFWIVMGGSLAATAMAVMADLLGWKPPGGLFALFGFAVCASTPDASWRTVATAAALSAASAAFAIVVSSVGPQGAEDVSTRPTLRRHLSDPTTRRHALRHFAAPLIAGSIAVSLDIGHPYWGMVASIVPLTSPSLREMAHRGLHRLVGTGLGLLATLAILLLEPSAAALVVVIIVAQTITEMVVLRHYALALVFITPLALLMGQLVHPMSTEELITQRGVETLVGVAVGLGVAWLTRRPQPTQANRPSPQ
jgi:hypothetical protein